MASPSSSIPPLLLWSQPALTAAVFIPPLVILLSLTVVSLISVLAWSALLLLAIVAGGKIYVYVMVTLLGKLPADSTSDPLLVLTTMDMTVPADCVVGLSHTATDVVNSTLGELRRLFLAESILDTVKFGASLYCLTYIGSWFNLLTLVIMAWCALFALPKVYLNNQEAVDDVVSMAMGKVEELKGKVNSVIPGKSALKEE